MLMKPSVCNRVGYFVNGEFNGGATSSATSMTRFLMLRVAGGGCTRDVDLPSAW